MSAETSEASQEQLKNELGIAQRKITHLAGRIGEVEILLADKAAESELFQKAYRQQKEQNQTLIQENEAMQKEKVEQKTIKK